MRLENLQGFYALIRKGGEWDGILLVNRGKSDQPRSDQETDKMHNWASNNTSADLPKREIVSHRGPQTEKNIG